MVILGGCQKDDSGKTGQVTFSGTYNGKGDVFYTVTINGKTGTFADSEPAPECGTISNEAASFVLPAGTYKFTFDCKTNYWFTGNETNESYPGQKTITIPEGGCVSVRWD